MLVNQSFLLTDTKMGATQCANDLLDELLQREEELMEEVAALKTDIAREEKLSAKADRQDPLAEEQQGVLVCKSSNFMKTHKKDLIDTTAVDLTEFDAPEWCVPIRANVLTFDWARLASASQFDVILMDPPWQLASNAPTRGV